jgi:hypothetical protein
MCVLAILYSASIFSVRNLPWLLRFFYQNRIMDTPAIIYLEDAWNDNIVRYALNPLEEMLELGSKDDKQLFDNKEYIATYS